MQPKLLDEKQTTVYKRAVDKNYHLKMKASRFIFSEIREKFPIMPFTARFVKIMLFSTLFVTGSSVSFVSLKKTVLSCHQSFGREKG